MSYREGAGAPTAGVGKGSGTCASAQSPWMPTVPLGGLESRVPAREQQGRTGCQRLGAGPGPGAQSRREGSDSQPFQSLWQLCGERTVGVGG